MIGWVLFSKLQISLIESHSVSIYIKTLYGILYYSLSKIFSFSKTVVLNKDTWK